MPILMHDLGTQRYMFHSPKNPRACTPSTQFAFHSIHAGNNLVHENNPNPILFSPGRFHSPAPGDEILRMSKRLVSEYVSPHFVRRILPRIRSFQSFVVPSCVLFRPVPASMCFRILYLSMTHILIVDPPIHQPNQTYTLHRFPPPNPDSGVTTSPA